uniref:Uncharacterized protein n=1 Tax=Helicotheca tamesis TaxID=374047 RepID=A0A7S2HN76_9STRA
MHKMIQICWYVSPKKASSFLVVVLMIGIAPFWLQQAAQGIDDNMRTLPPFSFFFRRTFQTSMGPLGTLRMTLSLRVGFEFLSATILETSFTVFIRIHSSSMAINLSPAKSLPISMLRAFMVCTKIALSSLSIIIPNLPGGA